MPAFLALAGKTRYRLRHTEEEFFKKIGIYSRYLMQFIHEGDIPKILDAIKDLEKFRQQTEAEKIQ